MKYTDLMIGDTIYYKNIPEFLSRVQRVVMDMPYSHCSLFAGEVRYKSDIPQSISLEFEADVKVRFHSLPDNLDIDPQYREVFRFINTPQEIIDESMVEIIREFEGEVYAFLQWLSIFIRRCGEWLGFKKARSWRIFWGWTPTVVCSELLFYFIERVTLKVISLFSFNAEVFEREIILWKTLLNELYKYNPDTFTPKDLAAIQRMFIKRIWMQII